MCIQLLLCNNNIINNNNDDDWSLGRKKKKHPFEWHISLDYIIRHKHERLSYEQLGSGRVFFCYIAFSLPFIILSWAPFFCCCCPSSNVVFFFLPSSHRYITSKLIKRHKLTLAPLSQRIYWTFWRKRKKRKVDGIMLYYYKEYIYIYIYRYPSVCVLVRFHHQTCIM